MELNLNHHGSKAKVLFLCSHNAARSQIAEGYLRAKYGKQFEAFSAGSHPSIISKYAIQVMAEIGIDISSQKSKTLMEFYGQEMDIVVAMCDEAKAVCPVFPWAKGTVHKNFPDPHDIGNSDAERLNGFRKIRDAIITWIDDYFGKLT